MPIRLATILAVLAIAVMPVLAHHAFTGEFDNNKPVTLEGQVTSVSWENPHVYYYIDVKDASGAVLNWKCETRGPQGLERQGWKRDTLKVGDKVVVHGFLARNGGNFVDGRQVTLSDGRKITAEGN